MKFVCQKSDLQNAINTVSKAVPNRSTLSILECILFEADKNTVSLTANDMELAINTKFDGQVSENGKVALDAKFISSAIGKLPNDEVSIECDQNLMTVITSGKAKYEIPGKPADEFSSIPTIEKNESIVMSQMSFRDIIKKTSFSIMDNADDTPAQQTMRGEHFEIFGDSIRMSSLDGHRISICREQLRDVFKDNKMIIPGKSLKEIGKILNGGADDNVDISYDNNHIQFEFDRTIIISRLIDGKFFDVDKMNIKDYETKININKKSLIDCLDRASILVKEGDKKPIVLDIKDGSVNLMINSVLGSMDESIDVEKTGKDLMIAFNPKFLLEVMRVIDDENVDMFFVNSKAPCYIKNSGESYVYVVLPVNFNTV